MNTTPPLVMTFSALDSTSGAGLVADALTINALKCHPLSVLSANTLQNTAHVLKVVPVDADFLKKQARMILAESKVAAFKIGVLGNAANILAVAEIVQENPHIPAVLDPIIQSGAGDSLSDSTLMPQDFFPLLAKCFIATPNAAEARFLSGKTKLHQCATFLLEKGLQNLCITTTDESKNVIVHHFYTQNTHKTWVLPRLQGQFHGSGCTFSSALACGLAHHMSTLEAIDWAFSFTAQSLKHAFCSGSGQSLPYRRPEGF